MCSNLFLPPKITAFQILYLHPVVLIIIIKLIFIIIIVIHHAFSLLI